MKKHLFFVVILAVIFAVVLINHNEKIENSVVTGATPVTERVKSFNNDTEMAIDESYNMTPS
ncbi:hypothetical protein KKG48_00460 [Patescibacteria group bacterium]|nr:hypothetical protein [Patescibacteria group bacterium]